MKRVASSGVAAIALRSKVPILPVGITGTERLGPLGRVAFPTGKLTVTTGQPFTLPSTAGTVQREQLDYFTEMIMERVAYLLPEDYRGAYRVGVSSPLVRS